MVSGISHNLHESFDYWSDALEHYTNAYCNGNLVINPLPNTEYDTPVNPADYGVV